MKARLLHYSEFADDLDQASPLKIAASRSKAALHSNFWYNPKESKPGKTAHNKGFER